MKLLNLGYKVTKTVTIKADSAATSGSEAASTETTASSETTTATEATTNTAKKITTSKSTAKKLPKAGETASIAMGTAAVVLAVVAVVGFVRFHNINKDLK